MLRPYKCKNNRKRRRGRTEVRPYKHPYKRRYKHGCSPIMMRLQKCLRNAQTGI